MIGQTNRARDGGHGILVSTPCQQISDEPELTHGAVRWVDPPALVIPEGQTEAPSHAAQGDAEDVASSTGEEDRKEQSGDDDTADMAALYHGSAEDE